MTKLDLRFLSGLKTSLYLRVTSIAQFYFLKSKFKLSSVIYSNVSLVKTYIIQATTFHTKNDVYLLKIDG